MIDQFKFRSEQHLLVILLLAICPVDNSLINSSTYLRRTDQNATKIAIFIKFKRKRAKNCTYYSYICVVDNQLKIIIKAKLFLRNHTKRFYFIGIPILYYEKGRNNQQITPFKAKIAF